MMKIEYFLMQDRTEEQIRKLFGAEGFETVKGLEKLRMARHKTENNETLYSMGKFSRIGVMAEARYWLYVASERMKT